MGVLLPRQKQQEGGKNETVFTIIAVSSVGFVRRPWGETQDACLSAGVGRGTCGAAEWGLECRVA